MASGSNEASSIYSSTATETSTSTIYGLGYLSGRAIKRLGESVLNGVDYIFINRQLRRMEIYFAGEWREKGKETKEMCGLLLEFTHPGYVPSVRMRAFRLIMYQIGDYRVKGLVSALVETQSISTRYRHLTEVRDCIASIQASNHETAEDSSSRFEKARAYLRAGRESYLRDAKHRPAFQLRRESLYIPALLYFTAISAHNAKENVRLVHATDTIGFLRFLGLFEPSTADLGVVAGTLLLKVLHVQLRSLDDPYATKSIDVSLSTLSSLHHGRRESIASDIFDDITWVAMERTSRVLQILLHKRVVWSLIEIGRALHMKTPAKLLLLGCGESGKTTIFRQLDRVHRGSLYFRQLYDLGLYITKLTSEILSFLKSLVCEAELSRLGGAGEWAKKPVSEAICLLNDIQDDMNEVHRFISDHTLGFSALEALAEEG
ncbi:hypothetical protein AAF712_011955, partial [Marasmius tenuissimus]